MALVDWIYDGLLALLVLGLAFGALYSQSLYRAVVFYIALGLVLALVWARLGAPDLALAEAAIGAGLTGVLLLSALKHQPGMARLTGWPLLPGLSGLAVLLLLVIFLRAVWGLPPDMSAVGVAALEAVPQSGVEHPVTAVLLNFRAWDTLLELLVVLMALLALRQLTLPDESFPHAWPLLLAWSRLLAPLSLMLGIYLLWRGADAPGGAFQSGALIAAGLLMLRLVGLSPQLPWSRFEVRLGILVGPLVFLLAALATASLGAGWLAFPADWSKAIILLIEVAATISIAVSLALLVGSDSRELTQ